MKHFKRFWVYLSFIFTCCILTPTIFAAFDFSEAEVHEIADWYKKNYQSIRVYYDPAVTQIQSGDVIYLAYKEILKQLDITFYPDRDITYEKSASVPFKLLETTSNGSTFSAECNGTLRITGRIVYKDDQAIPYIMGTLSYTAQSYSVYDTKQTPIWVIHDEYSIKCEGEFWMPIWEDISGGFAGETYISYTQGPNEDIYHKGWVNTDQNLNSGSYKPLNWISGYEFRFQADGSGKGIVHTDANEEAGETDVSVPAILVVGTLGAVAAAGAAGAAGTGADSSQKNETASSSYKMYIRKDFGNKIKRGGKHVFVYARMAEIKNDGTEVERLDLTQRIVIFSQNPYMDVGPATLSGAYMGASVRADYFETGGPSEGVISFKFSGEGGIFQNNVKFQLVGDAYLRFPEQGSFLVAKLPMLWGDGGRYLYPVELCDFLEPVDKVVVKLPDTAPVTAETEKISDTRYLIYLANNSAKVQGKKSVSESFYITVIAENQSEQAEDRFILELLPEGFSVRDTGNQFDDEGYFKVSCYPDENYRELSEIVPTRFTLQLAVGETDSKGFRKAIIVPPTQLSPAFGNFIATTSQTKTLVSRYSCQIEPVDGGKNGVYRFVPQEVLPEPQVSHFYVRLPITADYGGQSYAMELDVRLIGQPLDPMAGWDDEYARLQKNVGRFGISQSVAAQMRMLSQNRSTNELRLLNKMLLIEASYYYTDESKELNALADHMETLQGRFEMVKWVGDQAFSILITMYAGPAWEMIATPAKDIFTAFVGETAAAIYFGEGFRWETLQVGNTVAATFESYLLSALDGKDVNVKKAGAVIAGFAVFNVGKHYLLDVDAKGNRDFYKAVLAGFGDLTSVAVSKVAGVYLGNIIKNPKTARKLDGWFGDWFRRNLPDMAIMHKGKDLLTDGISEETAMLLEKSAILQKYVEGLFGKGAAQVHSTLAQANESAAVEFDSHEWTISIPIYPGIQGPDSGLYLNVSLTRAGDMFNKKFFGYIIDKLFGNFPFMPNSLSAPGDPPYYTDCEWEADIAPGISLSSNRNT